MKQSKPRIKKAGQYWQCKDTIAVAVSSSPFLAYLCWESIVTSRYNAVAQQIRERSMEQAIEEFLGKKIFS